MNSHGCSPELITAERNKRLLAWMADILNLEASERPEMSDRELAHILCERLPPQDLILGVEDARKLIRHFHDIAASWLQECKR